MNYLSNIYYLYAKMDRNSKFLLYMILLIIFLLILIVIISLVSKNKQKKLILQTRKERKLHFKKNIKPLDFSDLDEETLEPSVNITKPKELKIEEPKKQKIENVEEIEEIEVIEVMDESVDEEIESIKKSIEKTLETEPINLNKWEQEQEESAIISYDELVKKAGAKKIVYKNTHKKSENKQKSSFSPSQVVSPIYGVKKDKINEIDKQIDSFSRIEKLRVRDSNTDMETDIEFLEQLKKFRNELN